MTPAPQTEALPEACEAEGPVAEMNRIRAAVTPSQDGSDKEDLATYAKEVVRLREENHGFRTWGIIEVAVRNPSVAEYMDHWEARAEAAESALSARSREVERLREALKPFGECAPSGDGTGYFEVPDEQPIKFSLNDGTDDVPFKIVLTNGDLRRARQSLEAPHE